MAFKNLFIRFHLTLILLVVLFFLLPVSFLQAQNPGYYLDSSGDEIRFIQRLTWIEDEYARRYEVIIEREERRTYSEMLREFTTAHFIELSLFPGKYRFLVIPYDFFNQSGERSEWMYFEVLAALNPELDDDSEFVFSEIKVRSKEFVYEMQVSGKNVDPGAEIYLLSPEGERFVPSDIQISRDGSEVQLVFDRDQLPPGDFELIVINPGGLETSKGGVTVVQPPPFPVKKINLLLTAGWMPSFTLYDYENRFFGQKQTIIGAVGRLGMVMAIGDYFSFGFELAASYNVFKIDSGGQINLMTFGFNLLALKWFPGDRVAAAFRLGAGYGNPSSDIEGLASFSVWEAMHTNMGVSFLLFVFRHLYLEAGLDYANWLMFPPSGSFRPWVGVGVRF